MTEHAKSTNIAKMFLVVLTAALVPLGFACTQESGDDGASSLNDSNLFQAPAGECRGLLEQAENAEDPVDRDLALMDYQDCVSNHSDMEDELGGADANYAACYDILEAVVRLQDDVDENLIRRLHREYVDCVFDYVDAQVGDDPNEPPRPDQCEWLLEEANERCQDEACFADFEMAFRDCMDGPDDRPNPVECIEIAHRECEGLILNADANGSDREFEACLERILMECEGQPVPNPCDELYAGCEAIFEDQGVDPNNMDPNNIDERFRHCIEEADEICNGNNPPPHPEHCEEILREAEQVCLFDDANGEDPQGCWEQFERMYQDCLGQVPPPHPEHCEEILREAEQVCLFDDPNGPDPQGCWEEFDRMYLECLGEVPPQNECETILRDAEEVCLFDDENGQDPQGCWEEFERMYRECLGDVPPPNECEMILREAEQVCHNETDPNGVPSEDCWLEFERQYEECIGQQGPPPSDVCLDEAITRCEQEVGDPIDPSDPDGRALFERCLEEAIAQCEPPAPNECDIILEEAHQVCGDNQDPGCWEDHELRYQECLGG